MNQYYAQPYAGMYQQPNMMAVQNRQSTGIIWVNGEEGARAFVMAPNSNAILMDEVNEGRFYIKTTDNIGMCNIRTFNFKEVIDVKPANAATNAVQFATKQDIQELRDMMGSFESRLNNFRSSQEMKGGQQHEQPVQPAQYSSVPATTATVAY